VGLIALVSVQNAYAETSSLNSEIEKNCNSAKQDILKCISYGEQANSLTQYIIGRWYETGIATAEIDNNGKINKIGKPDIEKAIYWYVKSANNGDAGSAYRLGEIYYYGSDVLINYKEAAKWFRKSIEGETPFAAISLASMYSLGQGVEKNDIKSLMWLNIALLFHKKNNLSYSHIIQEIKSKEEKLNYEQINYAQNAANVCRKSNYKECND